MKRKAAKESLPTELVTHVSEGCGERGAQWFDDLPGIVGQLETEWSIFVEDPFPGIEYNYVAPATRSDGKEVVLKIAPPWEPVEIFSEAEYLHTRDGIGCVRLFDVDRSKKAILIERVRPGEALSVRFKDREMEAIGPAIDVLRTVLRRCTADEKEIADQDNWYAPLRNHGGTGFPAEYAEKALAIYDRLSAEPDGDMYLHGDYHPGNIVTVGTSDFIAIDPKGLVGHVGYEIAVFLNNFHWWQESRPDVRDRLDAAVREFATAFEISQRDLREWAYAQMVLGAWWNFTDMPALYDGSVAKADIWRV